MTRKNRIICLCFVKEFDNAVRFRFFVVLNYFFKKIVRIVLES